MLLMDGITTNRTLEDILSVSHECGFGPELSHRVVVTAYQQLPGGGARLSLWLGGPDPGRIEHAAKRLLS